jgi:hypothetical protein
LVYVPQALPLTGGALTGPVTNSASFTLSGSLQTFGFTTGGGGQFGMFAYNDTSLALGPTDGGGTANNVWAEFRTNGDFHPWGTILLGTVNSDPSSIVGGIEMYPGFGGFGVSANTLNYNWHGVHQFIQGGNPIMQLSGGLYMQSPLGLWRDPVTANEAATKQYVDNAVAAVRAGTTTNDNALAGQVGEVIQAVATATAITNGVVTQIASIALTAGDWDVFGLATLTAAASAVFVNCQAGPSSSPTAYATYDAVYNNFTTAANALISFPLIENRVSLAAGSTVYLLVSAGFASGTATGQGRITARRRR